MIDSIDVAADLIRINTVTKPDPAAAAVYAYLLPIFAGLYDALTPTFQTLQWLAPLLAVDRPESTSS